MDGMVQKTLEYWTLLIHRDGGNLHKEDPPLLNWALPIKQKLRGIEAISCKI